MSTTGTGVNPIALQQDEGEALWFLGVLATVKASAETTGGRVAVIEHRAPQGSGSPLHLHRNEDEWFYVTEGVLTFWIGGRVVEAPAGSFVYGPRGVPHTPACVPLTHSLCAGKASEPRGRADEILGCQTSKPPGVDL